MINWGEILTYVLEAIVSIAIPMLFVLLRKKIKNETALKLIDQAESLVVSCVRTVEQTIVIPLKSKDEWTEGEQQAAYEVCKAEILNTMNDATIKAIQTIYGDLEAWCKAQIESEVLNLRKIESK